VNKVLAREILTPYRPGTADQNDPEFAEALAMVRGDPELARWFDEHCARYEAIRAKFQQIPISEGLKEQIISERKAHQALGSRRKAALFAVAAAFVLALIAVSSFYHRSGEDKTFSGFRNRMAKKVTRVYPAMDLETSDPQQIRRYLAQNQGHADYVLPAPLLEKSASTGCAILRWQNEGFDDLFQFRPQQKLQKSGPFPLRNRPFRRPQRPRKARSGIPAFRRSDDGELEFGR